MVPIFPLPVNAYATPVARVKDSCFRSATKGCFQEKHSLNSNTPPALARLWLGAAQVSSGSQPTLRVPDINDVSMNIHTDGLRVFSVMNLRELHCDDCLFMSQLGEREKETLGEPSGKKSPRQQPPV
ncbi:hypothetical protein EVAR_36590_1 [Eumeta japonica]|uniref:Uncharacterized protein n=1 Tax=Eumeta variegata TaxID=151549 RepID=A0A4C1XPA7_EUMVA|nr:hypothetical protein EVAR_36590_1 [Eumeta japonica]